MQEAAYSTEEFYFDSTDGKHRIHTMLYEPSGDIRAILQFSHGMTEHIGRYCELAAFLASRGIVFCGGDHLGHGRTAENPSDRGFFTEDDGADTVVSDLYKLSHLLKQRYPKTPLILAGHSMGSFLARLYTMNYGVYLDGVILIGTGGQNKAVGLGKLLASVIGFFKGPRHRSHFLKRLTSGNNNKRCKKEEGAGAWLSRDAATTELYKDDPLSDFIFSVRAYYDLYDMVDRVNKRDAAHRFPEALPVLILAGDADPVGGYGKGPREVYQRLLSAGVRDVRLKLYPEARHELHNELCRAEFFGDICDFVMQVADKGDGDA